MAIDNWSPSTADRVLVSLSSGSVQSLSASGSAVSVPVVRWSSARHGRHVITLTFRSASRSREITSTRLASVARLRDLCGYSLVTTLRSKQQSNTCTSIIIRAKLIYEASHVGHASCDTGCDGTAPLGKNSPRKSRPLPAALAVTSQRASLS